MAVIKEAGMGWTTLTVDDGSAGAQTGVKSDVTNFQIAMPRGVQDVTGVDKSAYERLLLLADFSIELNGVFDDQAGQAHVVFKTVSTTSINRTVALGVSGQTCTTECIFTDYALTRAADGSLTWKAPGQNADGIAPSWS